MPRFVDEARVHLKAGDGGRGCIAFRREKYIPKGGPSGGDGGDGGDIIFKVESGVNTLYDFRRRPQMKAGNGRPGMGDKMSGKRGRDFIVRVPPGTIVREADTDRLIVDLLAVGQEAIVAKGGRGGRGNQHFATATNRTPRRAEDGSPGQDIVVDLELRSIADVGLVGLPNAGKSTLLRAISNATPEVAPYPFTTLTPHLGVVEKGLDKMVVADIPGLIEGASAGKGLGHEFLRHIERTSVLLYVIDVHGSPGGPAQDLTLLRREVMSYSDSMKSKKSLVALNKCDLLPDATSLQEAIDSVAALVRIPVIPVSGLTKMGIPALLEGLFAMIPSNEDEA